MSALPLIAGAAVAVWIVFVEINRARAKGYDTALWHVERLCTREGKTGLEAVEQLRAEVAAKP